MFNTEVGNVTISSGIIYFANARKYFEKIRDLWIFWKSSRVFYTIVIYGVILSLEVLLIAPVIASAALYCIDSIFRSK